MVPCKLSNNSVREEGPTVRSAKAFFFIALSSAAFSSDSWLRPRIKTCKSLSEGGAGGSTAKTLVNYTARFLCFQFTFKFSLARGSDTKNE